MFKTVTVSFRTRQELLESLDLASRESMCSRSSLIEKILRKFLADIEEKGIRPENSGESKGAAPAEEADVSTDGLVHVTVGKVRIGLPRNLRCKINFDENGSALRLDLASDEENMPRDPFVLQDSRITV
jgi:hypothetical protein